MKQTLEPETRTAPAQVQNSIITLAALLGEALRRISLFPILRLYTRPAVEGLEHIPAEGPYIFAANHSSHLDAPLMLAALPPRLRLRLRVAAAADYFFTSRLKGALVATLLNAFPFERKGPGCSASLDQVRQLLASGYSILFFPEGTRSPDGRLQPFKRGIGNLALATSVPVVPTWIEGACAAMPKGATWPHPGKVRVRFGTPMRFALGDDLPQVVAEIEHHVAALAPLSGPAETSQNSDRKGKDIYMVEKRYGGIYAIKPWWQHRLANLESLLIKQHIHPDVITSMGVVCSGLLGIVLIGTASWPLLALPVAPLAIGRLAANALDGLVARHTGLARPWGEVFNEGCDRLSDMLIFAGLALNSHVSAPLALTVLALTLLNSYVGVAAKAAGGKRQFGGLLAKADRMIFLALFSPLILLFGSVAWNWLLLAFVPAIILTLIQRVRWTYADLHRLEERRFHNERALAD